MQSFHQSRTRIAFEVLCAFGISASLAGAWMQTYASAFIPAASIAALYGLVRLFDMIRRSPASVAVATSEAPPAPAESDDTVIRSWPLPASRLDEPKPVERAPAKAPRKKRQTSKAAPAVEESEVARIAPQAQPAEVVPEPEHAPIAPLFEPEPFVRTQRSAFGRKAG